MLHVVQTGLIDANKQGLLNLPNFLNLPALTQVIYLTALLFKCA